MPGNFKREDLRIIKTHKSLANAMQILLSRRNFEKITVNDLCQEALVSKTAFYAHFNDKYDLLKYILGYLRDDILKHSFKYSEIEKSVNQFIRKNTKFITNLMEDANSEVLELLHDFMYSIIEIAIKKNHAELSSNQVILSNFCAGGMVDMLNWQVKNKFPLESQMISDYFYNMLKCLLAWDSSQTQE